MRGCPIKAWMRAAAFFFLVAGMASIAGCKEKDREATPLPEYGPPRPTLLVLNPTAGFIGETVAIVGTNFDPVPANNIVSFNGGETPALGGDTGTLVVIVPLGASSGPLTVRIDARESNALDFTILGGPQIFQLSPDIGPVGTLVTIDGTNFSTVREENTILFEYDGFGGVKAPALSATGARLTCYAPAGADTGLVVVQVGPQTSNSVPYTYITPVVTDLFPRSGVVGDSVVVFGENFIPDPEGWRNVVRFNGTFTPTLLSPGNGTLLVSVPPGAAAGPVTVEHLDSGYESNGIFFCVWTPPPPAPRITSVTPNQGAFGDAVTIQGANFAANVTDNEVRFNGILATVTSATTGGIDTTVPAGATTGPITIRRGQEVATSSDFTVSSPPPPPPILDVLRPAAAMEQSAIVLEGAGFHPIPGNNVVTFAGVPAEVLAASATSLLVRVPFTESGVVTVQVGDAISNGLNFTVQGAPAGLDTFPLFGRQIASPSNSVIYVVDLSGSMNFNFGAYTDRFGRYIPGALRWPVVVDRLTFSISELPTNFRFNVIGYSSVAPPFCQNNFLWQFAPVPATQANKDAAIAWLSMMFPQGGTATTLAVEAALQMDPANRTICLITDGVWNCPTGETNADQLCRMFNANLQNAEIHTFGVMVSGGFSDLLRDIASITGGTYTKVDPPLQWP